MDPFTSHPDAAAAATDGTYGGGWDNVEQTPRVDIATGPRRSVGDLTTQRYCVISGATRSILYPQ
jgi:hypothetical protein